MVRKLIAIAALVLATDAAAPAQVVAPNIPNQAAVNPGMQATPQQVRDALWIRALQSRRGRNGGGVRTGVPQFVPFGNMMGMPSMFPSQQAPAATDKAASKKSASRKADFEAARAERKKKSQERAEKRKAEAAARRAAS